MLISKGDGVNTQNANILYIDSSPNREVFEKAFKPYYPIFTASTFKEALQILHHHSIALIISQQNLQGMSGVQFFEAIIPEFPDPLRILMSAVDDEEVIIEAINKANIFKYVNTPWNQDELKKNIAAAIKMYSQEMENRQKIQSLNEEEVKLDRIFSLLLKSTQNAKEQKISSHSSRVFWLPISLLMVSINGLNQFIEKNEPKEVCKLLEKYYEIMTECIEKYRGTVDKTFHTSLIGIFGAPIAYEYNEKNALFCAITILEKLRKLNLEFDNKWDVEIEVSIGIHSGKALVGAMGARQFIIYTAMGSLINTVEKMNEFAVKHAPNAIFITNAILKEVKDNIKAEEIKANEVNHLESKEDFIHKVIGKKI